MLVLLFADPAPSAPPLEYSPGKRFVDFSTARQREVIQRVAKKTRKRGQVCTLDVLCVHVLFHVYVHTPTHMHILMHMHAHKHTGTCWLHTGPFHWWT